LNDIENYHIGNGVMVKSQMSEFAIVHTCKRSQSVDEAVINVGLLSNRSAIASRNGGKKHRRIISDQALLRVCNNLVSVRARATSYDHVPDSTDSTYLPKMSSSVSSDSVCSKTSEIRQVDISVSSTDSTLTVSTSELETRQGTSKDHRSHASVSSVHSPTSPNVLPNGDYLKTDSCTFNGPLFSGEKSTKESLVVADCLANDFCEGYRTLVSNTLNDSAPARIKTPLGLNRSQNQCELIGQESGKRTVSNSGEANGLTSPDRRFKRGKNLGAAFIKQSWLLRLFQSKHFDMSIAIQYLFNSKEPGVQSYIGK